MDACSQPSGFVADDSDCMDSSASIYPGAAEYCNGSDDDCDGAIDEYDAVDSSTWYADADGDGFGDAATTTPACSVPSGYVADATDCDDAAASTNPDADEYCDGHDDDCDGDVDEDSAVDADTWYLDGDGDGYGVDSSTSDACEQPSGYAAYGGDCDDGDTAYNPGAAETDCADPNDYNCDGSTTYTDADGDGFAACEDCDDADYNAHPGADEYCDGHDDDCDGDTDEDDAADVSTFYVDSDGDGYGDIGFSRDACSAPTGYVVDASDCDDGDAAISPGSVEVCGDGLDNDCDGTMLGCAWSGSSTLSSPDAKLTGEDIYDTAGWAVAALGDVDSDGYDDFVVGARDYDSNNGAAYLVLGPITGTSSLATASRWTLSGVNNEHFSFSIANVGDLDGDGEVELAVTEGDFYSSYSDYGTVYLYSGPLTSVSNFSDYSARIEGEGSTDEAGTALSGGMDVYGDGGDDMLIGAPYFTDASAASGYWHGSTYLFHGPVTGELSCADFDAQMVGTGVGTAPESGTDVAMLEDTNGDGLADILIGAPHGVNSAGVQTGLAFLVNGPVTGTVSLVSADAEWSGESSGDNVGSSVSSGGDVDGDGYGDLLIGAQGEDTVGASCGAVYLVLGPASAGGSIASAQAKLIGYAADDRLGEHAAAADDFDVDGFDDVVVASARNDLVGSSSGGAWVFFGPVSGTLHASTADAEFLGTSRTALGASLVSAGDVDGSGTPDLLIGAAYDGTGAGAAYLQLSPGM